MTIEPKISEIIEDGIINPIQYDKETIRLLIICKEPNKENHEENSSFQTVWNNKPDYQFAHRVAELAYGILDGFKAYNNISGKQNMEERYKTLQRIAFMNVKKEPGTAISNNANIKTHITQRKRDILEQIATIKPTHILAGLSEAPLTKAIFAKEVGVSFEKTSYGLESGVWNGIKILHFYHPSARVGNAALYALLKVTYEELGW